MSKSYYDILSADPLLEKVFRNSAPHEFKISDDIPMALYSSIMSQQLSVKVADVILKRFMNIFNGVAPTPQQVLNTSHEELRAIGLSNAKANYVKNVAQFAIDHGLQLDKLQAMSDEEIFEYVSTIKGVGKWTIHLLLMFSLGREDIFVADDLGVQNAMAELFDLDKTDRKKIKQQIITIAEKWSPYRSYLNIHLWQWLNNRPKATIE